MHPLPGKILIFSRNLARSPLFKITSLIFRIFRNFSKINKFSRIWKCAGKGRIKTRTTTLWICDKIRGIHLSNHPLFNSIRQIFDHIFASQNKVFFDEKIRIFRNFLKLSRFRRASKWAQTAGIWSLTGTQKIPSLITSFSVEFDKYLLIWSPPKNKCTKQETSAKNKKTSAKTRNFCRKQETTVLVSVLTVRFVGSDRMKLKIKWQCLYFELPVQGWGGSDYGMETKLVVHFHGLVVHFRGLVVHFHMAFHLHHLQTCFHAVAAGFAGCAGTNLCTWKL